MSLLVGFTRGGMTEQPLRILQVNTADLGGGAERVAWNLHRTYRAQGHQTWLAVGQRYSTDKDVLPFAAQTRGVPRLRAFHRPVFGSVRAVDVVRWLSRPQGFRAWWHGEEDFEFPASWRLLDLPPVTPQIVHAHNLHGGYFDVRMAPSLSRRVPLFLTLHDAWLLSGHCAHSFDCERWKTGCGHCPDLGIYPAIRKDATAFNWQRKHALYAQSRLYVATPSRWLMRKVEQSILAPAIIEAQVIPNGVDLSVFHPANQQDARREMGLPADGEILLCAAHTIRRNMWKDYRTLQRAVTVVGERRAHRGRPLLLIGLGETASATRLGAAHVQFVPYQHDPAIVARYYQAADVYLHASRADTFPTTILEALACGTPGVATAVGGIPEQINSLQGVFEASTRPFEGGLVFPDDEATGILAPPGDGEAMAIGIERLLADEALRRQLGQHAARDARQRFGLERQAHAYLAWYARALAQHGSTVVVGR